MQHAHLVRSIAQILSAALPIGELLAQSCVPLALLVDAQRVSFAIREGDRDRIIYTWQDSVGAPPEDDTVDPDSLVARVFVGDETVAATAADGASIAIPIRFGRTLLGVLALDGAAAADLEVVTLLESCALHIGARIFYENTLQSSERFAELAFTDGLTAVANRRKFDEALAREWSRGVREQTALTLLIVDIDFFKDFNDSYGHHAGDICLQHVARALADCVKRPTDLFARYGGEEFVALLPGTDIDGGIILGEQMRDAVSELHIAHGGSTLARISLSIGVAACVPGPSAITSDLVRSADGALYTAKNSGRNRVVAKGYESASAPAERMQAVTPNNLPLHLTRLIGRRAELDRAKALFESERLVSIVGGGGTGKTRMAQQLASESLDAFPDGVWFVDLSPLRDRSLIAATIASTFGGQVGPDDGAPAALARIVHAKKLLLVIDNGEHLIDALSPLISTLLRACANVHVLVTSREPLEIDGEIEYQLPPLTLPPARTSAAKAMAFDAVALFVERAKAASRSFVFSEANVGAIVEIVRLTEGVALTIELAAARLATLGVGELAERLGVHMHECSATRSQPSTRSLSVRSMVEWSYTLLSERERTIFRRLSVFAGRFRLEAAIDITGTDGIEHEDVFEIIASLIRTALVVDDSAGRGESTHRLLDPTREYARGLLDATGESESLARRHAEYYVRLARRAEAAARTMPSREWLRTYDRDLDNARAALEWALTGGHDTAIGAALIGSLATFFADVRPTEGNRWVQRALAATTPTTDAALEARLWLALAATTEREYSAAQIRAAAERAIELYRELDDPLNLSEAIRVLAQIIGWFYRDERAYADELACESIAIALETGDAYQIGISLRTRGLTLGNSDFPQKRAVLEESLRILRTLKIDRAIASTLMWLSELEFSSGDVMRAFTLGREGVEAAEAAASPLMLMKTHLNLATYSAAIGYYDTARTSAAATIAAARDLNASEAISFAIQALAYVSAAMGDPQRAARLMGFCDSRVGLMHAPRAADQSEDLLYRRLNASLHASIPEGDLLGLYLEGAQLVETDAIEEALLV